MNVDENALEAPRARDFLRTEIAADVAAGRNGGRVHTRFPPEPNGYLHIGHAKAICLNFELAREFGGLCNLRFDDTNPVKEDASYVDAIREDIRWLGFDWDDRLFFASDYFEELYEWARRLIEKGAAYVCDLPGDEVSAWRGSATEPGRPSPCRDRAPEENLDLFARMRAGEFEDGARTLRAKIDMASPHMLMRDPVMYRILRQSHHRTGDAWCLYPTYDWAHGQSDAMEGITHSICSLEFRNHRPLYDWFLEQLELEQPPRQIEFNRLNLTYTVLSKRKLLRLVEDGRVSGWDDPRMPTLSGLRRRGVPASAIRTFCERVGVTKVPGTVEMVQLENAVREDLNERADRALAVLRPLKLVIENYPEDAEEEVGAIVNPADPDVRRPVPFSRELWIERDDFREEAPRKYFRLTPGREVRLKYAYYVTCTGCVKDDAGEVIEVRATYDPESRGGNTEDGRKVKGTIQWVSARHAVEGEVRLYDHLFDVEHPEEDGDLLEHLNPGSLEVVPDAKLEPSLASRPPGDTVQFERSGYFSADPVDHAEGRPVFNRTVALRDSWAKIEKKVPGRS
jgi:glutaminyl-tRNA synthetase